MALELDSLCGRYLTFRDLIECGETWRQADAAGSPINNEPVEPASLDALVSLCETVLDPVIDEFGSMSLTYCLAGANLSRRVEKTVGRIAPRLDQHAAFERNRRNRRVCDRGGVAADFRIAGQSSLDVAKWVVSNTQFDRLWYYGPMKPIHVSANVHPLGQVVILRPGPTGKRIPRVTAAKDFVNLS